METLFNSLEITEVVSGAVIFSDIRMQPKQAFSKFMFYIDSLSITLPLYRFIRVADKSPNNNKNYLASLVPATVNLHFT